MKGDDSSGAEVIEEAGLVKNCSCAADWLYRMHSRWYAVPREAFNVAIYCFVGLYKILILVFCLIPYLALLIAGA
jgi:hypothetical protein